MWAVERVFLSLKKETLAPTDLVVEKMLSSFVHLGLLHSLGSA